MTKLTHDGPQIGLHSGCAEPQASSQTLWYGHLQDFTKITYGRQRAGFVMKLTHNIPQVGLHQECAHVQGQRLCDTSKFGISQKSLIIPGRWLHPDQTQSFANLPFHLSVRFSSASQFPKYLWVCVVSSAIAHMVKQFVRLFAIQYGLMFCLYVCSLYEAPLHSPSRLSIRQLGLMSTSWNKLLRHWRSSCIIKQSCPINKCNPCIPYPLCS